MRPLERGLGSKHAVTPDSAQGVLGSRDGRQNDGVTMPAALLWCLTVWPSATIERKPFGQ
ncbi:MAG: hypothetical protein OXE82_06315 [Rhodobacter sp.]|nr:hypothetical protein [Rhodobacter sp.]